MASRRSASGEEWSGRIGIVGFIWLGVIFLALVAVIRNEAREAALAALRQAPGNKQEVAPDWPARVQ
jgi:hypothetical protein